jgi:hypothetical protein
VNEKTRCHPDNKRTALYREMQVVQDQLSLRLREVFALQRRLT